MSGKYHRKKNSTSNYPQRLKDRGLSKAPTMPGLDYLRRKQTEGGKLRKEYISNYAGQIAQSPIRLTRTSSMNSFKG